MLITDNKPHSGGRWIARDVVVELFETEIAGKFTRTKANAIGMTIYFFGHAYGIR